MRPVITIHIPTAFRTYSGGRESVDVELAGGGSLRRIIELLEAECPGIKGPLMFEGGVHPSVSLCLTISVTVRVRALILVP